MFIYVCAVPRGRTNRFQLKCPFGAKADDRGGGTASGAAVVAKYLRGRARAPFSAFSIPRGVSAAGQNRTIRINTLPEIKYYFARSNFRNSQRVVRPKV